MAKLFDMKDMGEASPILGMRIQRDRSTKLIWLSQSEYIDKVLQRFNMDRGKALSVPLLSYVKLSKQDCPESKEEKAEMDKTPYAFKVGSLMYAMIATHPDIAFAVGVDLSVINYIDSDYAIDLDNRRSTSGYVFTMAGGAVSWRSRLQTCATQSTTEAEYVAASEACKEAIWLGWLATDLGIKEEMPMLHCDSQNAIQSACNPVYHSKTKHVVVKYHFIRETIEDK
ncbi:hypothetical protein L7F22_062490 [Adiantum nelumboides]|nr:hypothetical protein [Adiantum nelumboides]MCO5608284.1 hypothetical protein [Adiantum nelumboides]